jgi:hypothetical protein
LQLLSILACIVRQMIDQTNHGETPMRFMMLMIPAAPDAMPDSETIKTMVKYNYEMGKAGVLLALEGLHPPASGARVSFKGGRPTVTDGPFPEVKEVLGGFWILEVRSRDEAIEWARRCPVSSNDVIEIRRVHEMSEAPEDVQKLAEELDKAQGR